MKISVCEIRFCPMPHPMGQLLAIRFGHVIAQEVGLGAVKVVVKSFCDHYGADMFPN